MARRLTILQTGLIVLFLLSPVFAQNNWETYDKWGTFWVGQNMNGILGPADDPCTQERIVLPTRFPGADGQEMFDLCALWVGALIVEEGGSEIPRVSTASEGWLNPDINEFWPDPDSVPTIFERSRLDTTDCWGNPIYSAEAVADHEYIATFCDTVSDPFLVRPDFDGTLHRPLGLRVTRTSFSFREPPCDQIVWVKYLIENIGENYLKNLYIGHLVWADLRGNNDQYGYNDDLVETEWWRKITLFYDNDGRAFGDGSGNDFTAPHALGMAYWIRGEWLRRQDVSSNWWMPNADANYDYGPAWEDHAEDDSLDLGWTAMYGSPMGDSRKYQLMSNREIDFAQVWLANPPLVLPQPVPNPSLPGDTLLKRWYSEQIPENWRDIANGHWVNTMHSFGPTGIPDYQNQSGDWIFRLNPGESFECWFVMFGGRDFHDPAHPQPTDTLIEPGWYNYTNIHEQAAIARSYTCIPLGITDEPGLPALPESPILYPAYPNPFNARATIGFDLPNETDVKLTLFDILGRNVATLAEGKTNAGQHRISFDGSDLPSGVYVYRLDASKFSQSRKMVLLK